MTEKKRRYPQQLFLTYSVALIAILLCIFGVVLFMSYREQYTAGVESRVQLAEKTGAQLDASLQGMDRIINGLLFNKAFIGIMKDDDAMAHYTGYSRQALNLFVAMDAPLFPTRRIIAFRDNIYYNLGKQAENQEYIQAAIKTYPWNSQSGEKLILPPHPDPFDPARQTVYSVIRGVVDGNNQYGMIEVQNDYNELAKACELEAHIGRIAVFTSGGDQIYPLPDEGQPVPDWLFDSVNNANIAAGVTARGYSVSYSRSEYSGWITVIYCPVSGVVRYAFSITVLAVTLFALLVAAGLVTIRILANRLTRPLVDMNKALANVSLDNLELPLPQSYKIVEIENIYRTFQMVFSELKEAIAKNIQLSANEEHAKYLALQSQMNPHTIYNTIGMIESVSYMNGDMEVSNLCICFSEMLRYISDYEKQSYTVSDEIKHLADYTVLIKKRYEGKLEIESRVETGLENRILPKFTIQPLVENAVKHGFGSDVSSLCIKVAVRKNDIGWELEVCDNGKGFTPEALREFEEFRVSLVTDDYLRQKKIGKLALANIYIRCHILYGEKFRFEIESGKPCGARVKLIIPEVSANV